MRDPKRIRRFCDRLSACWESVPDWRFGQLMLNIFSTMEKDPFYVEDDKMIEFIEQRIYDNEERKAEK